MSGVLQLNNCTPAHVRILQKKLSTGGVSALIDKHVGQTTDYKVNEAVKGKIMLQWSENSVTSREVSTAISRSLKDLSLPEQFVII